MNTWKTLCTGTLITETNPTPVKIVYNPPHTIVQWKDGQSIRVTCSPEDTYSKELGLAYCLAKKLLGQGWYRKLTECEIVDLTQKAIMFEPLEPKVFDWNEFLSGKTAVRCEGKKQVEAFVKMRKKQNSYPSGMSTKEHAAIVIRNYGENLIFTAAGFMSAKSLYGAQGYKVIPFDEIDDWGMR